MADTLSIDVSEWIDRHRVAPFQATIVMLCFLIVAIDGFDTASIGFIAPVIRSEWGLSPAQLAPVFGAGLAGLMAGALVFGPFGDRFGRKRLLLACVACFGIASAASASAGGLTELIAWRFVTGLGLGGAMPNAITLTSEYCPARRRSLLVTTMFCGFTIGSALGGLAAASLIERDGWRAVLVVGGVAPLLLLPLLAWQLPESVRYLVNTGAPRDRIAAMLARIAPDPHLAHASFVAPRGKPAGSPLGRLFSADLLRGTLLLWLTFFMSLLVIYLLSSWLPTLLRTTGATLQTAARVTAMFQVGGTLGAIVLGWLMDRFDPQRVLACSYAAAGVFVAAIGVLAASPVGAALAVFAAGFCVSGSQVGANALSAAFYPTECRTTGVSWANGIGRGGSVVGSMAGGAMLAMGLPLSTAFAFVAVPCVIAGIAVLVLGAVRAGAKRTAAAEAIAGEQA
ncbi:4-hydroxybenzoate transporter [Burkholderia diffusa]|uniref:4-hydroxybenzoate transporter n=1 Tax=Burkholderia diffusa TaxID=488732 RepID=A0AAW3PEF4_9BURK|nr:aromatic acid/H+ symport family MFS transporter [Burkholderia diffusa]KWF32022.1 4-hydroxybenzoate transporter [Burkholderia diffusa]KWF34935.1 4-hydroxybenzoate transporter [Burkholderia diffusa]KWF48872.1 4-hydroxybenzoate transporter [Burkholderia diffusa]KWF51722.1 4-hydroxybenzoate transporter [Burkholderia diffusa]